MNKPFIIVLFALVLLPPIAALAQVHPTWLTLPQNSVASTDDALALLVNPAGLGVEGGGACYFLAPYQSDGRFEDWGIVVGEGFAFAAEALRSDQGGTRRRYTWGAGFGDDDFTYGFNYSWTTGIDRQNTWDFGILERPWSFLSVGAVARGVNNPRLYGNKLSIGWDMGVGLRPLAFFQGKWARPSDRLTFNIDAKLRRFDEQPGQPAQKYFEEIDYTYGIRSEIIPGITGHLDYSPEIKGVLTHDARIWAGLTFNFGDIELGSFQRSGNGLGSAYIAARDIDRDTWLDPVRKRVIIIDTDDADSDSDEGEAIEIIVE